tara:strand:- start:683 stop:952 length:270 start_codon:yes stop_codon:yes gene_type:complete
MKNEDSEKWQALEREIRERYHLIEDTHSHIYAQRAILIWADNNTFDLTLQQLQRIIYGDRFVDVNQKMREQSLKNMVSDIQFDMEDVNT